MLQWSIGNVKITRVVEMLPLQSVAVLLPAATPERLRAHRSWMYPTFIDDHDNLKLSIHAFVIETQGQVIVVDTCVGNDKDRSYRGMSHLRTPFLEHLHDARYPPEAIDIVLCTHLHFDHVGWNTTFDGERWIPTFPRARYLFGRREWEFWRDEEARGEPAVLDSWNVMADSVRPLIDAGLVDLVDTNHHLTDEVWVEPTPGHTPGHIAVRISSAGQDAVITGDLAHTPLQFAEPTWAVRADNDSPLAIATREAFIERYSNTDTLVLGTHFPSPTGGRIVTSREMCHSFRC